MNKDLPGLMARWLAPKPDESGPLAEMAANALELTPANEGKRWQATDDGDRVYSYRYTDGAWDYYPETGADSNGNILVTLGAQIAGGDTVNDVQYVEQGNGFVGRNFTASSSAVDISPTGKAGDKIHKLIVRVTGTGSLLTLVDGANTYQVLSTGMVITTDTGGANVYLQTIELELNMTSENGGWAITTGTNALGVVIGRFS